MFLDFSIFHKLRQLKQNHNSQQQNIDNQIKKCNPNLVIAYLMYERENQRQMSETLHNEPFYNYLSIFENQMNELVNEQNELLNCLNICDYLNSKFDKN